mgnify:CR=1 FL=1
MRHALVWNGTADSVVDLNVYLPAGYTHGVATGIDQDGNVVGYAYNTFVAGVTIPPNHDGDTEASLDELALLVDTAGADPVARLMQRRQSPDPATFLGKGKVEELAGLVDAGGLAIGAPDRVVIGASGAVSSVGRWHRCASGSWWLPLPKLSRLRRTPHTSSQLRCISSL